MKYRIIIAQIVFVLALFPYVSFGAMPFDTQPWALIAGIVCIFTSEIFYTRTIRKVPRPLFLMSIVTFYALVIFLVHIALEQAIFVDGSKSLWAYTSLIVFAYIGYIYWKEFHVNVYIVSAGLWLLAALSQLLFGLRTVAFLLPRFSTGGYRGLTSLAPEPSFYATMCIAMLVLNEYFFREKRYNPRYATIIYFGVCVALLSQLVLSFSGVGIGLLLLFIGSKIIELIFFRAPWKEKKIAIFVVALSLSAILLFIENRTLAQTRGGYVLAQSIARPASLLQNDLSVSNRLANPVLGIYGGIVEQKGFGFGLGTKSSKNIPQWLAGIHGEQRLWGGRIEGGFTAIIYELGIIGLLYIGAVFYIIFMSIYRNQTMRPSLMISAIAIFFPLCIFGSLALPMVGLFLGAHLFYSRAGPV